MAPRVLNLLWIIAIISSACGESTQEEATTDRADPVLAEDVIRTADPYARGYTDEDFPRIKELATGVYSYEQLRSAGEERFATVSMFVVTTEGVLVADGQGSVEETQRMIDHIAEITDQPITHVVICSDHGDHTAGNSAFPSDAEFLAHPTSAATLEASANAGNRDAGAPPIMLPSQEIEEREVLELGGRTIEVLFLGRAHTGGDLVVHLPEEKILFMSEAYLNRVFPAMRSAYPSEWVEMIERAQAMDIDTYVPGHGFVDSSAVLEEELDTYRRAVIRVIELATQQYEEGYGLEDAQIQANFGELESWSLFTSQASRAIQQVYAELDGTLSGESR
jgi:glyoxylase-like metal-dependent hydrolase (beta-lactamase superfamily II)